MTTDIRFDRLQTLAKFLHNLPKEQVGLNAFMHPCGTLGCILGWATQIPEFQAEGLTMHTAYRTPVFEGLEDYAAGRAFFGLPAGTGSFTNDPPESQLFYPTGSCKWDDETTYSYREQKRLAMHRLRRLFETHGRKLELS